MVRPFPPLLFFCGRTAVLALHLQHLELQYEDLESGMSAPRAERGADPFASFVRGRTVLYLKQHPTRFHVATSASHFRQGGRRFSLLRTEAADFAS